jgi:hypothetical protein
VAHGARRMASNTRKKTRVAARRASRGAAAAAGGARLGGDDGHDRQRQLQPLRVWRRAGARSAAVSTCSTCVRKKPMFVTRRAKAAHR